MDSDRQTPMLEMSGISKRFGPVVANDEVDLAVSAGRVHTLLGENGAGKSTLMKILYGLHRPDAGTIRLDGEPVEIGSPADAIARGIGMIHQHFMLVPTLTVAENVALGLRSPLGRADMGPIRERLASVADRYGLAVDPDAQVWQLAVGERQRAEILKALYRDARILVLDEPTAVLTPPEVDDLFATLRQLTADGRGLVFISHKLHEVMELSDDITVLRDGRVSGRTVPAETSPHELAELMVGRAVQLQRTLPPRPVGVGEGDEGTAPRTPLLVEGLTVRGDRGLVAVDDVSIAVERGEIVGVAGVSGNGQRELAEAIVGLRPVEAGTVVVAGSAVTRPDPAAVRDLGLAYVPEERMRDGVVAELTVAENLMLLDFARPPYARRGLLDFSAIRRRCGALVDAYSVKTPTLDAPAQNLSGGNIQKLVIAREFSSDAEVLVVAQPTRGVDIGAAEYIHERLLDQRAAGAAVLLISEDLDEVLALSDRVVVMYEGRVMGDLPRDHATIETVGLLMSGVEAIEDRVADRDQTPNPFPERGAT